MKYFTKLAMAMPGRSIHAIDHVTHTPDRKILAPLLDKMEDVIRTFGVGSKEVKAVQSADLTKGIEHIIARGAKDEAKLVKIRGQINAAKSKTPKKIKPGNFEGAIKSLGGGESIKTLEDRYNKVKESLEAKTSFAYYLDDAKMILGVAKEPHHKIRRINIVSAQPNHYESKGKFINTEDLTGKLR